MLTHRPPIEWSGKMNILTIIGVVVIAMLVAGSFGVHIF